MRVVYDLADIWAESERDHMENPDDRDILCRDLSAAGYRCPNTVNDPPPGPLG
jgi:hypothetical protein